MEDSARLPGQDHGRRGNPLRGARKDDGERRTSCHSSTPRPQIQNHPLRVGASWPNCAKRIISSASFRAARMGVSASSVVKRAGCRIGRNRQESTGVDFADARRLQRFSWSCLGRRTPPLNSSMSRNMRPIEQSLTRNQIITFARSAKAILTGSFL